MFQLIRNLLIIFFSFRNYFKSLMLLDSVIIPSLGSFITTSLSLQNDKWLTVKSLKNILVTQLNCDIISREFYTRKHYVWLVNNTWIFDFLCSIENCLFCFGNKRNYFRILFIFNIKIFYGGLFFVNSFSSFILSNTFWHLLLVCDYFVFGFLVEFLYFKCIKC